MNVPLLLQQRKPVENMWEGFDRFLKVQEMGGKLADDLTQFKEKSDKSVKGILEQLSHTVNDESFQTTLKTTRADMREQSE